MWEHDCMQVRAIFYFTPRPRCGHHYFQGLLRGNSRIVRESRWMNDNKVTNIVRSSQWKKHHKKDQSTAVWPREFYHRNLLLNQRCKIPLAIPRFLIGKKTNTVVPSAVVWSSLWCFRHRLLLIGNFVVVDSPRFPKSSGIDPKKALIISSLCWRRKFDDRPSRFLRKYPVYRVSNGRGAAKLSEVLTWGAEYLIRNMTLKKFVRATRPTFLCASPKTIPRENYHTHREFLAWGAQPLRNVSAKKCNSQYTRWHTTHHTPLGRSPTLIFSTPGRASSNDILDDEEWECVKHTPLDVSTITFSTKCSQRRHVLVVCALLGSEKIESEVRRMGLCCLRNSVRRQTTIEIL